MTNEASVQGAIDKTVATFGCIDVVLNNAGYALAGAVEESSTEEAKKLFDIDFFAVHTVMRCVLPHMRAQHSGYIINIASIAAAHASIGLALYGAAKAAVVGMTTTFVDETAHLGIKATCVCPGPFATSIQKEGSPRCAASIDDYDVVHKHLDKILETQYPGDPEKAAKVFLSLAETENPPLILYLGPNAVGRAKAHHTQVLKDIAAWEAVACGTDLDTL